MSEALTLEDLAIEVWEELDCENVGAKEIESIENVLTGRFGPTSAISSMRIARILADEGAELRHAEIMRMFVDRAENDRYEAAFQSLNFDDLGNAVRSLRQLNSLRQYLASQNDRPGLDRIRRTVSEERGFLASSRSRSLVQSEVLEWLRVWLENPDIFETWIVLRQSSPEFTSKFGLRPTDLDE